jgi:hypothetical protein
MSRQLESEDVAFRKYLAENGYEYVDDMGLKDDDK